MCERSGKRNQRFACARLTQERYKINIRVHQKVKREALLAVSRADAPDGVLALHVVAHNAKRGRFPFNLFDLRHKGVVRQVNKKVRKPLAHQGTGDFVPSSAVFLPALHLLAVRVPKIFRQLHAARVEHVGVIERFVRKIVFCRKSQRRRFNAHVDIF